MDNKLSFEVNSATTAQVLSYARDATELGSQINSLLRLSQYCPLSRSEEERLTDLAGQVHTLWEAVLKQWVASK